MKFEIHWSHFIILAALGKKVFCDDYIDLTTSGDNEITGISFVLTPGNPPPVLHGQLFWGHTLYEKYFDRDTLYAERDASRFATAIVAGKSTWLPCISKDPTNVNKCPPDDRPQCEAPPGKWCLGQTLHMDNDLTSCFLGDKLLHLSTQNITEVVAEDSKSKPKYFVVDAGGKIEISYQKTEDLAELNRDVPPTWLYRWTRTITQNGIKTVGSILAPKCTYFQLEHVADTWNDTDKAIYDNLTVTLKKAVPDFGKLDPNSTSFTIKGCYQNEVNGSIIDNGIGKIWQFSRIEFREMLFNRAVDNKQLFPPNASARCLDSIHYRPAGRRHRSPNVIDLPPKSKLDGWLAALSWKDLMPKPEGKVNPKPASGKTKPQKSPSCKPPLGKLPSGQKGSGQGGQPIGIPVA